MKTTVAAILIVFGLYLHSCRSLDQEIVGSPAIKSVAFVGIPPQNIDFDQGRSTITIKIPSDLRDGLQPILELTDGTRVVSGITPDGFLDLTPLCYCQPSQGLTATLMVGDSSPVNSQLNRKGYLIKVANQGPLKALDSSIPLTFSLKTKKLNLRLPVENLYTNPKVDLITFTNVKIDIEPVRISADATCLNTCDSKFVNQLIINLTTPIEKRLKPGTYKISAGGIDFPQKLIVTE